MSAFVRSLLSDRGNTRRQYPLGASVTATSVDFNVFSYNATDVELLLSDSEDAIQPSSILDLIQGRVAPRTTGTFTSSVCCHEIMEKTIKASASPIRHMSVNFVKIGAVLKLKNRAY